MGPYITAFLKTKNYKEKYRKQCFKNCIKPIIDIYGDKWDGSINEIFDGDPIYSPRGCMSQAWSVSEILRSWIEDIDNIRPKYEKEYTLDKISV